MIDLCQYEKNLSPPNKVVSYLDGNQTLILALKSGLDSDIEDRSCIDLRRFAIQLLLYLPASKARLTPTLTDLQIRLTQHPDCEEELKLIESKPVT